MFLSGILQDILPAKGVAVLFAGLLTCCLSGMTMLIRGPKVENLKYCLAAIGTIAPFVYLPGSNFAIKFGGAFAGTLTSLKDAPGDGLSCIVLMLFPILERRVRAATPATEPPHRQPLLCSTCRIASPVAVQHPLPVAPCAACAHWCSSRRARATPF